MKRLGTLLRGLQYTMLTPRALQLYCLLLAYLIALLALAPASLMSALARQSGIAGISLLAPSGRLWHGEAQVWLDAEPPQQAVLLGTLAWHWQIGLSTQPSLYLRWNGQPAGMISLMLIDIGHINVRVQHLKFSLPADSLGKLSPILMPLGLKGHLNLECPHFELDGQAWHGTCTAHLAQAQSSLTRIRPLGDYQLTLLANGVQASLTIDTLQGSLQLQGNGQLTLAPVDSTQGLFMQPALPASLKMNGTAGTDVEHRQALQALLRVLGNPSMDTPMSGNPLDNTRFHWGFTWQAR